MPPRAGAAGAAGAKESPPVDHDYRHVASGREHPRLHTGGGHESNKAALGGQTDELLIKDVHSSPARKLQCTDNWGNWGIINSPSISQVPGANRPGTDVQSPRAPAQTGTPRAEPGIKWSF